MQVIQTDVYELPDDGGTVEVQHLKGGKYRANGTLYDSLQAALEALGVLAKPAD